MRASTNVPGPSRSPRGHRTHPLEVSGLVTGGRLEITLTYGSRVHRRETMERLAAAYAGALRQLIEQAQESEEVFTPSDFPKARLDAKGFGKLAALLAKPTEPGARAAREAKHDEERRGYLSPHAAPARHAVP